MSVLKSLVFVGFVLLSLISVSHAGCWLLEKKPGATRCQDSVDKTWHKVGSTWKNSRCDKCSCGIDFGSCCHGWPMKVSAGCSIKYDFHTCEYEIINDQPGTPCGAAGK
ncbi:small serum protein 2-like isoform X3 [Silurus meridionalis]|uniref:small serum protein 2-like isoform X3 n=1 Tax=Silurus meridionalis TaxID=175797 RepID=UPI001EEC97E5|nr:small serum protein 2-like isoform X3 [Silurus meridionalis]